jgi:hypothetical protein
MAIAPPPSRRVVRLLDRKASEAEGRKAETLARYEEEQRAATAASKSARMKALHADPEFKAKMKALNADPEFKAKVAKGFAARSARIAEKQFEKAKARLVAARKAAGIDTEE